MAFDPKSLVYGKGGIPILKAVEIEAIATEVLRKFAPKLLSEPGTTPVVEIIEGLKASTELQMSIEDLGYKGTSKILGKVNFVRKTLSLDTSLTAERAIQMRFTAAHEIGHWILHRWNYKAWTFEASAPDKETLEDDDASLCRLEERTPQDWLEWQANVFAASLTMPRAKFLEALVETQISIGIIKNLGRVWINGGSYDSMDVQSVLSGLSNTYQVSKASVKVRLNTLNLLIGNI